MGTEIERKYLVTSDGYRTEDPIRIRQGYLNTDRERIVRVRLTDSEAFLTIKGLTNGISRSEFEYPIDPADAEALLLLCEQPVLEKTRHRVEYAGKIWDVDVFEGANEGLVTAEIELETEDEPFERPEWVGVEVTDDPRYFNANLVRHPYADWK